MFESYSNSNQVSILFWWLLLVCEHVLINLIFWESKSERNEWPNDRIRVKIEMEGMDLFVNKITYTDKCSNNQGQIEAVVNNIGGLNWRSKADGKGKKSLRN